MSVSAVLLCCLEEVYIHVFNSDVLMCTLKFCVVCINDRRYVCCSECNVVSNERNEPSSCVVQPIGKHGGEVMYFMCVCFWRELGFLNCDDISMCIVN